MRQDNRQAARGEFYGAGCRGVRFFEEDEDAFGLESLLQVGIEGQTPRGTNPNRIGGTMKLTACALQLQSCSNALVESSKDERDHGFGTVKAVAIGVTVAGRVRRGFRAAAGHSTVGAE